MRADDRRRERTVAALGDGYAAGALGTETLTLRVDAAYRARSVEELRALTADLPRRWTDAARDRLARLRPPRVPAVTVAAPPHGTGPWTIGRSDACRLVIAHGTVSRRHAMLSRTPEGLEVRDLGSLNGTYVNGWRVDRALLRPGDTLSLGDVRLLVRPT
ncbi:MAG TPA: DUF1707 and FHA domain-containing protein [Solirubrobacteraceae bacterium]|jgi:hypothetical protein|nr:DUF1707 and FHA domain-containing protein [Solirubrobacteraceae bacterium]